ncbi:hypothetical protein ACQ4PT_050014 [Festuca glaucescens]
MAEHLASVQEESTTGVAASCRPSSTYRESIRSVAWPQWQIRSAGSSQSGQSGSTCSSISGASSSSVADFGAEELTEIAHRMVSDGYTQRMVQAFSLRDGALHNWFVELDVDWVLEICGGYGGSRRRLELLLQNSSTSRRQEFIDRWVRALTIIVVSTSKELVAGVHDTLAAARFGKASISAMLVVVAPILAVLKVENLQAVLHMYMCVSSASRDLGATHVVTSEAQSIFNEICVLLERKESRLIETISNSLSKMRMALICDDSWVIDILRGGGEVHKKIQFWVGCIVLMRKAHESMQKNSTQSHKAENLRRLIDGTIGYTKDLLLRKSEFCSDPSLRYMFRLNNSYFLAHEVPEPSVSLDVGLGSGHHRRGLELTPECEQYMKSYLDVSWGHVLSCILQSDSLGQPKRRKKNSSLAKFQSEFHKTYQAQKFWKVPDPQLRSLMRETITKRVIPGYRHYLQEHPELEKQDSGGSNSPEVLEEMLGELFEG